MQPIGAATDVDCQKGRFAEKGGAHSRRLGMNRPNIPKVATRVPQRLVPAQVIHAHAHGRRGVEGKDLRRLVAVRGAPPLGTQSRLEARKVALAGGIVTHPPQLRLLLQKVRELGGQLRGEAEVVEREEAHLRWPRANGAAMEPGQLACLPLG